MNLEDLEKRLEKVGSDIGQRLEEISQRLDDHLSGKGSAGGASDESQLPPRRGYSTPFWGVALVVIGVILLGNHFDWFDLQIPVIPTALIILGCYLILENR